MVTKSLKKIYTVKYAPTLRLFHNSDAFVRGIRGPFGSGKSTACCAEILKKSQEQVRGANGKRRTRWTIVRNSYPELKTTTLKTWSDWCPPQYGKLTMSSPIRHHIVTDELDIEVLFMALDTEDDIKKLLSLEVTGVFLNETREIRKSVLDGMTGRVGRFPSAGEEGCTWSGVFMDTNPPDDQHWWYELAEENTPKSFEFFAQPSGLAPPIYDFVKNDKGVFVLDDKGDKIIHQQIGGAENLPHLPKNYYERISEGKDPDWVKVYVHGDYGYVIEGKPVYPSYRDAVHCNLTLQPTPRLPLLLGIDFGHTPAMIIGQKQVDGSWKFLDELCADDGGVMTFAIKASEYMALNYPEFNIGGGWGDPAGKAKNDENRTTFEIMNEYFSLDRWKTQWKPSPDETNDLTMRLEAVRHTLNTMVDGHPRFQISPKCKRLRKAMAGNYHYKFFKTGEKEQVQEKPSKNMYSHPADAHQYLVLGGGEHDVVLRKVEKEKRRSSRVEVADDLDYDLFEQR